MSLITFTKNGIYCKKAGIYVDPVRKVNRAIITHGHSDHARSGHKNYLCTPVTKKIIKHRLGSGIRVQSLDFGEIISINGVRISLHPAGHIPGSAQVKFESQGEICVVTGDFKTEYDGVSRSFELIPCHTLVMESTFALPIYKWRSQDKIFSEINDWWERNIELGKMSIITAYALGKAQRVISNINSSIGPIYTHGAIEKMNLVYQDAGIVLPQTHHLETTSKQLIPENSLIVTTSSDMNSPWLNNLTDYSDAMASGWMALRGMRKNRSVDKGFILSDHADWDGLNLVVEQSGAETVYVTHGYVDQYSRWLNENGIHSIPIKSFLNRMDPETDS